MNDWTTGTTISAVALGVLVVLALVLTVALVVSRRRLRRELAQARQTTDELARRLDELESPSPAAQAPATVAEFVITDIGQLSGTAEAPAAPERPEGRLFVDVVLRETVVKAASWSYGLGRALSAENRNRLRFEMRRETRRAGKQRKADVKEALRQYYAREPGDVA